MIRNQTFEIVLHNRRTISMHQYLLVNGTREKENKEKDTAAICSIHLNKGTGDNGEQKTKAQEKSKNYKITPTHLSLHPHLNINQTPPLILLSHM